MTVYLLDTSILTLLQYGHAVASAHVQAHASDRILLPTVAIAEAYDGCLAMMRRAKTPLDLANAHRVFGKVASLVGTFSVVPLSLSAILRFEGLVKLKLNVGNNDLRIAALALEINATVVTANVRDFARVPGLTWADWSA